MIIKAGFLTFWKDFDYRTSFYFNEIEKVLGVTFEEDREHPDIVFHSCFWQGEPVPGKPNILIQYENEKIGRHANIHNMPCIGLVNDSDTDLCLPHWFLRYDGLLNPLVNKGRKVAVCSMFRHTPQHREQIINNYHAERISAEDKLAAISRYVYNIAVENSFYQPYVTEKLSDACRAGCIPIYVGGDLSMTPFNRERIIYPCNELPEDWEQWISRPVFNDNHREMYEERFEAVKNFFSRIL